MKARAVRRIALALIALLVYAQGSIALAACLMDRGDMAQAAVGHECCDTTGDGLAPQLGNGCVAHCTAELQVFEPPAALVRAPADTAVLTVPVSGAHSPPLSGHAASPTLAVPPRILFRSFQI